MASGDRFLCIFKHLFLMILSYLTQGVFELLVWRREIRHLYLLVTNSYATPWNFSYGVFFAAADIMHATDGYQ